MAASSQAIIAQMGAMFKDMDANMRQALQNHGSSHDPEKRARTDEVPKHDPFAAKA